MEHVSNMPCMLFAGVFALLAKLLSLRTVRIMTMKKFQNVLTRKLLKFARICAIHLVL